jgi:hypothetical protein
MEQYILKLHLPVHPARECATSDFLAILKEVQNLSTDIDIPVVDSNGQKLSFKVDIKILEKSAQLEKAEVARVYRNSPILEFLVHIEPSEKQIEATGKQLSDKWLSKAEEVHLFYICTQFNNQIQNLLFIANIAKLGWISNDTGWLFVNDEPYQKVQKASPFSFHRAEEVAEKYGWPEFCTVSILDAWNWAVQVSGFCDSFGITRTSRALAALSNILGDEDTMERDVSQIVWAILGIEALYSDNSTGIKSQIMDKTEVVLGKRQSHKKIFSGMYDFRSRLLHGDIGFPFRHRPYDAMQEFMKFNEDLWEYKDVAVAILIATFQKMIRLQLRELNFEYSLIGAKS